MILNREILMKRMIILRSIKYEFIRDTINNYLQSSETILKTRIKIIFPGLNNVKINLSKYAGINAWYNVSAALLAKKTLKRTNVLHHNEMWGKGP